MSAEQITVLHEYRGIDRSGWGSGPWDSEPDKLQWIDKATGLDCLMVRNHMGSWCGYVGVPEGHPYYGKEYGSCGVDAHGGLTYSDFCQVGGEEDGICHIPADGRPDRVWWLGFDCAHSGDLVPGMQAFDRALTSSLAKLAPRYERGYSYKDRSYVEREVTRLAEQVAAVTS